VPHHGTLIKVSADGLHSEIVANGFRAANGVCINPDGSFFVTDQEGHWTPKNRINWVTPGKFYGNFMGYHDRGNGDDEMEQPLVWLTNGFDRSPAELLWSTGAAWKSLEGRLLQISYGTGRIYVVPHETVEGQIQGGQVPLPLPIFPTGIMRGRFHPIDGQLYVCGMFAWAGNRSEAGGFFRVRDTGADLIVPVVLRATEDGLELTFDCELDREFVERTENYEVRRWSLNRTSNYGSPHVDEMDLEVSSVKLGPDGKTLFLQIPGIAPTMGMACEYRVRSAAGEIAEDEIHNTIHHLSPR
jgi:hypothetical protein